MERIVERSRALLEAEGGGAFGFYTSGQLFSEEYYTLGVIGKGGLGTPHMDGNTRLCTATAAQALKESFGCDGQPASYTDVDAADTLFLVGHNVAATQTVVWSRMLDRRRGPNPPALVVVDPRPTPPAREADLHLAVRGGTNLALLNALQHELFMGGHVRRRRPPRLPQLAQPGPHRRVGPALERRPHDHPPLAPPTHAMQIWRYAEQGSIKLLWISGTNPAVSLPELARIRAILEAPEPFVVVQDAFLTETARRADVVLPAALWGEKTGTFTNADRTVHLSERAVDPPGGARSDLDIFLDYARRMGFSTRDGKPLVSWDDPESAFEAWKACSRGRPCDYSGLSYDRLRDADGIQWPVTDTAPHGTERLYADGNFPTDPEVCEDYGHDLAAGAEQSPEEYRAKQPGGRAFLRAADFQPGPEQPDDEFPLLLTTGRTLYHFHTRTKTGRAPELQEAAPEAWLELSAADADRLGVADGDLVRVCSRRGAVEVACRITGIAEGMVFVPFHYARQAANELTLTAWDPVSKQPLYKTAAVRLSREG
jgi:anaerobic selenocysteine-containing dehydrogenase